MKYKVIVLSRAELQLHLDALWWAEHRDVDEAIHWADGFDAAIAGLTDDPQRHPRAHEDNLDDFPYPLQ